MNQFHDELVDQEGWLMLKNWHQMSTVGAEKMTDDHLLRAIEENVAVRAGWGLLAELMKRYARTKGLL